MIHLDYDEVHALITMNEVIETIEKYYLDDRDADVLIPERLFIHDHDNTALLKPSFYKNYYGVKLIGIAPGNVKIKEPTLRGIFLLNDRRTMKPLGLFDARSITALRTGAISGLSMKYLAKKEASRVGVIGTGDQGWSHLQAACAVRPIKEVFVHNRSPERMESFIERAKRHFSGVTIKPLPVRELVDQADIIILTTTSDDPVMPDDEDLDLKGKHIAAAGAFKPHMQEIPDAVIRNAARIFVDTHAAFQESGDMLKAKQFGKTEDKVPTLKDLVRAGGSHREDEYTIFKSVGKSIYDILTAQLIYEKYSGQA